MLNNCENPCVACGGGGGVVVVVKGIFPSSGMQKARNWITVHTKIRLSLNIEGAHFLEFLFCFGIFFMCAAWKGFFVC